MEKTIWILPLLACGLAWPQDSGGRITVPFSDPSRPHTLKVGLINGGITVKGYDGKDAIIESRGGDSSEREHRHTPQFLQKSTIAPRGGDDEDFDET